MLENLWLSVKIIEFNQILTQFMSPILAKRNQVYEVL